MSNNCKTLILHISIMLFLLFINKLVITGLQSIILSLIVSLFISLIYIVFGYTLLDSLGSKTKDFISVSFISLIGIVMWIIYFIDTDYKGVFINFGDDGFLSEWWDIHDLKWKYYDKYAFPYYVVTFPVQVILYVVAYTNKLVIIRDISNLYLAFVPSLLIWFGILFKKRRSRYIKNI